MPDLILMLSRSWEHYFDQKGTSQKNIVEQTSWFSEHWALVGKQWEFLKIQKLRDFSLLQELLNSHSFFLQVPHRKHRSIFTVCDPQSKIFLKMGQGASDGETGNSYWELTTGSLLCWWPQKHKRNDQASVPKNLIIS